MDTTARDILRGARRDSHSEDPAIATGHHPLKISGLRAPPPEQRNPKPQTFSAYECLNLNETFWFRNSLAAVPLLPNYLLLVTFILLLKFLCSPTCLDSPGTPPLAPCRPLPPPPPPPPFSHATLEPAAFPESGVPLTQTLDQVFIKEEVSGSTHVDSAESSKKIDM